MQSDVWVKRLLETPRLVIEPRLAIIMGPNHSLIFRRFHDLMRCKTPSIDGEKWIYRTYENWKRKEFPWLHTHGMRNMLCYNLGPRQRKGQPEPLGILDVRKADRRGAEIAINYAGFRSVVLSNFAADRLRDAHDRCQTFHRQSLCPPELQSRCIEQEENLLDSGYLTIQPVLAQLIKLNPSILLRQLYFAMKFGRDVFGDGRPWVMQTISQWQGLCPWMHEDTITEMFKSDLMRRLVETRRHPQLPGLWRTLNRPAFCEMVNSSQAREAIDAWERANDDAPLWTEYSGEKRAQDTSARAFDREKSGEKRAQDTSARAFDREKSGEKRAQDTSARAFDREKSGEKRAQDTSARAFDREKSGEKRALESPLPDPLLELNDDLNSSSNQVDVDDAGGNPEITEADPRVQLLKKKGVRPISTCLRLVIDRQLTMADIDEAIKITQRKNAIDPLGTFGGDLRTILLDLPNIRADRQRLKIERAIATQPEHIQEDIARNRQQAAQQVAESRIEEQRAEALIAALSDAELASHAESIRKKYEGNTAVLLVLNKRPPRECRLMKMEIAAMLAAPQVAAIAAKPENTP